METEIIDNGLCAPIGYSSFSPEQLKNITNGCGLKGINIIIPDIIAGIDFIEPCNIHDFCYYIGDTIDDKNFSDELFFWNMIIVIKNKGGNYFIRKLREIIAYRYYIAVKNSKYALDAFISCT